MHCSPKVRSPPQRLPMGTVYLNKNSNNGKIESARGDDGKRAKAFFSIVPRAPSFSVSPASLQHKEASAEVMAQGTIKRATNTYNLFCNMMLQNEWVESNVGRFTTHVLQTCLATNQVAASHQKIELWSSSYSGTPANVVTNGPKKFGRDNELTVLTRVSLQENVWLFLPGDQ